MNRQSGTSFELNGVAHHVEVTGERGAPAFVFLHYFGGSSRSWAEVIDKLAAHARCVAPDLRGFGASAAPPSGYAVGDYVDDVAALVAAFGIDDYVLVGHSMGGKIALALAARNPAGLRALVLLAPSPPTPEPMTDDERSHLLATHGERAAARATVLKITRRPLPPALLERAVEDNLRTAPAAWRAWLEHGSREDISARMGNVCVPVTVLVGRHDPAMPRPILQREVIERVGGTLVVASDAGHLLPLESPDVVVHALREFVAGSKVTPSRYPSGTTRALLDTDLVTAPTREALAMRLAPGGNDVTRFFDLVAYATLRAACARLIPQPKRSHPVDLAIGIDQRLAEGKSDGWRYDDMPPDGEAYRLGLRGLDESARAMFDANFVDLDSASQDAVLGAVQRGEARGESWSVVPAAHFFEELLAECVEGYYSVPAAQDEIGYAGFADAHGWQAVGVDQLQTHEPRSLPAETPGEHV